MEDHVVSEPEEIGHFLYDIRNELTNYTCYYQFDPYREMQLEAEQVPGNQGLFTVHRQVA